MTAPWSRKFNWRRPLMETHQLYMGRPFDWATSHCLDWPAAATMAQTDPEIDPLEPWRGMYDDEASARAIVDSAGGMQVFMSEMFGVPPMENPYYAQDGDAVLILTEDPAAGVQLGAEVWCYGIDGLVRYPLPVAERAGILCWAVAR